MAVSIRKTYSEMQAMAASLSSSTRLQGNSRVEHEIKPVYNAQTQVRSWGLFVAVKPLSSSPALVQGHGEIGGAGTSYVVPPHATAPVSDPVTRAFLHSEWGQVDNDSTRPSGPIPEAQHTFKDAEEEQYQE